MPRPKAKNELIEASGANYEKLWALINSMTEVELNAEFDFSEDLKKKEAHWQRDKNLRDILIHLYEWHQLLLHWVKANTSGKGVPFLPTPYTWKTYGDMNFAFWHKHQNIALEEGKRWFQESHQTVMGLIDTFSNDELFTKQFFTWTGTTSLGSYFISATASRYDWAIKKIRAHSRQLKRK